MVPLPNLLIAGIAHGGTTSLFTYLSYHPEICASSIKETHYFYQVNTDEALAPIEVYQKYFKHCGSQKYRMEAGPGYMYGGAKLAQVLRNELGENIKLLFTIRDPVDRLFSDFKYGNKIAQIENLTFQGFVELSDEKHNNPDEIEMKDRLTRTLSAGFYAKYLREWYEVFDEKSIKVIFFDDLKKSPLDVMNTICSWLDIDPQLYLTKDFVIENRGFNYKNKRLHKFALFINKMLEPFFRKYPAIKRSILGIYSLNTTENPFTIDEKTKNYLEDLYKPHNEDLYNLLKSNGYNHFPGWLFDPISS